jgi:hypothetical protein
MVNPGDESLVQLLNLEKDLAVIKTTVENENEFASAIFSREGALGLGQGLRDFSGQARYSPFPGGLWPPPGVTQAKMPHPIEAEAS